jgi:GTP pyrophosphokinase
MVEAMDRQKLVRDITTVLGDQGVNILSASFSADSQHIARSTYLFEIGSRQHLEEIIRELKKVDAVYDVFEAPSEAETAGE